jgi:hypothetical protein
MVSATISKAVNLYFLDPEPLLFRSSSSSVILTRLFQTHYFSENMVPPGIEPGISGSVARKSDKTTEAVDSSLLNKLN